MNLEHLLEVNNKSKDFLELFRLSGELIFTYRAIIEKYLTNDDIESQPCLKESINNVIKLLDDIHSEFDIITHYVIK